MERVLGLVVAGVVVAGVAAAAVQWGDDVADPDVLVVAAERTVEAGTARVWVRTEAVFSAGAAGQVEEMGVPTVFEFEGVIDFAGRAHLRSAELELLTTGDDTYFTIHRTNDPAVSFYDAMATALEGRWVHSETQAEIGIAGVPSLTEAGDPAGVLELLRQVGEVEAAGEGEVRGDPVRQYTVTDVDTEALTRLFQPEPLTHEGTEEVLGFGVSVDDDGLVRSVDLDIQTVLAFPGSADADSYRVIVALEWWDFGVAVDVQPPPPEVTITTDELGQALFAQHAALPAEAAAELCPAAGRIEELLAPGAKVDPSEFEDPDGVVATLHRAIQLVETDATAGGPLARGQLASIASTLRMVQIQAMAGGDPGDGIDLERALEQAQDTLAAMVAASCPAD